MKRARHVARIENMKTARLDHRLEEYVKMRLKKYCERMWTAVILLMTGSGDEFL
jgi:hypothetical protein